MQIVYFSPIQSFQMGKKGKFSQKQVINQREKIMQLETFLGGLWMQLTCILFFNLYGHHWTLLIKLWLALCKKTCTFKEQSAKKEEKIFHINDAISIRKPTLKENDSMCVHICSTVFLAWKQFDWVKVWLFKKFQDVVSRICWLLWEIS